MPDFQTHLAAANRLMAQEDLYYFTRYMFMKRRGYKWLQNWHHESICDALMDVFAGRCKRLIINIPPRYSKSALVMHFIAWSLGRHPDCEFIYTSYSQRLAARNSWEVRDIVLMPEFLECFPTFPGLRDDSQARDDWRTSANGCVYAVGSGGTITGYGAGKERPGFGGCLIMDDVLKADEAHSDTVRDGVNDWFQNTLESRKNTKDTPIILIGQRLHENDLPGFLVNGGNGEKWRLLKIPAITYENEPLWPEKHSLDQLELMKRAAPVVFSGQYMQEPMPPEGGTIQPDKINIIDAEPTDVDWVRGWDLAGSEDGDYTAGVRIGRRRGTGRWVISGIAVARALPHEVEAMLINTAKTDGRSTVISLPQDPGQAGKPIWEEEPVLMGDGSLRPLKAVLVGDQVISKDGAAHEVVAVHEQGLLPVLRITTETGREIHAAPDHPFLTTEGWKEAGALTSVDVLALLTKPQLSTAGLQRTEMECRLAGYFVGDGTVGRAAGVSTSGSCHAEFTCNDAMQLTDFRACVASVGAETVGRKNPVQFGTKGLQPWLRATDLAGHTAYTKRVPQWVFNQSLAGVANFIGAYFACDGTVSKHGDEVIFYSVSKELLRDVQHLLLRFGISSTLKTKNGKYLETRHRSWLLRMRQQDDAYRRFVNRIPVFNSVKSGRLLELASISRFRRFDEMYLPDRVITTDPVGVRPCRCLTVKDAASFLVRDLVVHNSQVAYLTAKLAGFDVRTSPESGDKVTRAMPFAAQVNVGNVDMVRCEGAQQYLDQLRHFPKGTFDDQVDASSRAFNAFTENAANGLEYLRMLAGQQKAQTEKSAVGTVGAAITRT